MHSCFQAFVTRVTLIGTLTACSASLSAQGYIEVDRFDASVSAIERGIRETPDGSNHAILLGLRQLKDPAMRPLFQRLLSSDQPALRIDGLLALAETGTGSIDPFLLQQLPASERIIAFAAAIDLGLVNEELTKKILAFEDLQSVELAMALALQMNFGMSVDTTQVKRLLGDEDPATQMIGAILLADLGDSSELAPRIKQYAQAKPEERFLIASTVTDLANWHSMPSAVPLLELAGHDQDFSRSLRLAAIDAALNCKCDEGVQVWRDVTNLTVSSGDRTRLGVAALERGIKTPDWSNIGDDRRVNQYLAAAGAASATKTNILEAGNDLLVIHHPLLLQAALLLAESGTKEESEAIQLAIIENALRDPRLYATAGRVITDLANARSDKLQPLLEQLLQEEDSRVSEFTVIGLLNSDNPESGVLATPFREHKDRSVRSIALIIQARHGIDLDEDDLEELSDIAAGGGRVDNPTSALAAWLWLQQTDARERALARIVGKG